jgi:hypothetical protein
VVFASAFAAEIHFFAAWLTPHLPTTEQLDTFLDNREAKQDT